MSKWKDQDQDPNTDLDPDRFFRNQNRFRPGKKFWTRPGPDPDHNSMPMAEQAPHRKLHPLELVQHRRKSAACPKFDMVWLNRSPILVMRRGVISSFKLFLPAIPTQRKGVGVGTLWFVQKSTNSTESQLSSDCKLSSIRWQITLTDIYLNI